MNREIQSGVVPPTQSKTKRFRGLIDVYLPAMGDVGAVFQWGVVRCEGSPAGSPHQDEVVQFGQWSGSRESLEGWLEQLVELWESEPGPMCGPHGPDVSRILECTIAGARAERRAA